MNDGAAATPLAATRQPAAPSHPDGLVWLAELREKAEAQFQAISASSGGAEASAIADALLTLELRCKLEEQLLFSGVDAPWHGHQRSGPGAAEADDLATLRHLAARVRSACPDIALQRAALLALEAMTLLHFAAVDRLVARQTRLLDRKPLGRNVEGYLTRWEQELREAGFDDPPEFTARSLT